MIQEGETLCPECRNQLSYYDTVKRTVLLKGRERRHVYIRRLRCENCGRIHRELPSFILPYKRYEAGIIRGVVAGRITPETEGYEEYPCEETMRLWIARNSQVLLWKNPSIGLRKGDL